MSSPLECTSCEAMFKVRHDMDTEYYRVAHCPFCGSELEQEDELEFEYDFDE